MRCVRERISCRSVCYLLILYYLCGTRVCHPYGGDFPYPPLSSITLDSNHKYMKNFNPIGSLVVLIGALVLIVPALLDKGGNVFNLIGCVVMIAGFFLHIFLNKRITTIKK